MGAQLAAARLSLLTPTLRIMLITILSLASITITTIDARVIVDSIVVPDAVMGNNHPLIADNSLHNHQQESQPISGNQADSQLSNWPTTTTTTIATNASKNLRFDCSFRYEPELDKSLIVKWHFGDGADAELIYHWIPELRKRFVAPKWRAHIFPSPGDSMDARGFRLTHAHKSLAGKYTCTVTSVINDDSKSKRMTVYVLPRAFKFNATRTIINANLAAQRDIAYKRDRLLQQAMPLYTGQHTTLTNNGISANVASVNLKQQPHASNHNNNNFHHHHNNNDNHNPLAAARIGQSLAGDTIAPTQAPSPLSMMVTTIMPQFYSTIDYVNVNHMPPVQSSPWPANGNTRALSSSLPATINSGLGSSTPPNAPVINSNNQAYNNRVYGRLWPPTVAPVAAATANERPPSTGARLICDIDDVFPVPEVSIYRLAKLDGSYPEKLAKFETKIDKDNVTGSYHVQVTSIIDDLDLIRKYGQQQTSYFQCLIALPNLESTRYDSKRTIIYTPDMNYNSNNNMIGRSEDLTSSPNAIDTSSSVRLSSSISLTLVLPLIFALTLLLQSHYSH